MKRDGHENTTFFIGPEVELTPAFSKKTLFVVGYQDPIEVENLAREHRTPHIFLGANHSFDATHTTDYFFETWNTLITKLLDRGFWVTLDYPAHQHETVLKMLNPTVWQSRMFIPLLSIRIPSVQTSSINLTVKIDDIDFKATNPGVWCMHFREVTDSNRFTDWSEYSSDVVLEIPKTVTLDEPEVQKVTTVNVSHIEPVKMPEVLNNIVKEMTPVINDATLGLDTEPKPEVKVDTDATQEETKDTALQASPELAAQAYASGAKEDPLSTEGSKKKVKK